jgi:hypothetical protein
VTLLRSPLQPDRSEPLRSPLRAAFDGRPPGPTPSELLQEDAFSILQEDGAVILIE